MEKRVDNMEMRKLSLDDVRVLTKGVLQCVFIETAEGISYEPANMELSLAYFELLASFPELSVSDLSLADFFEDYCDGKYNDYLAIARNDGRVKYFEENVRAAVEAATRYYTGGRLANSASALIDSINTVIKKYSDNIDGIEAADIKEFIKNFGGLSENLNPESVTNAVIELLKSEKDKANKAKSKSRKTTKVSEDEKGSD